MTLHEYIEKLKKIETENNAGDYPVVFYENSMEIRAYRDYTKNPEIENMIKVINHTWDSFDGTDYSYEAYKIDYDKKNEDSFPVVII